MISFREHAGWGLVAVVGAVMTVKIDTSFIGIMVWALIASIRYAVQYAVQQAIITTRKEL